MMSTGNCETASSHDHLPVSIKVLRRALRGWSPSRVWAVRSLVRWGCCLYFRSCFLPGPSAAAPRCFSCCYRLLRRARRPQQLPAAPAWLQLPENSREPVKGYLPPGLRLPKFLTMRTGQFDDAPQDTCRRWECLLKESSEGEKLKQKDGREVGSWDRHQVKSNAWPSWETQWMPDTLYNVF